MTWLLKRAVVDGTVYDKPQPPGSSVYFSYTVRFGKGQLGANDGCNALGTTVAVHSQTFTASGDLVGTARGCANSPLRQAYNRELFKGSVGWTVSGGLLKLTPDGGDTFEFEPFTAGYPSDVAGVKHDTTKEESIDGVRFRIFALPRRSGGDQCLTMEFTPDMHLEQQTAQTMRDHSQRVPLDRTVDWLKSSPDRPLSRSWAPYLVAAAVAFAAVGIGAIVTGHSRSSSSQGLTAPASSTMAQPSAPFDGLVTSTGSSVDAIGRGGIGQRADGTLVLCGLGYGATTETLLTGDCSAINTPTIAELRPEPGVVLSPSLTKPMSVTGTYQGNGIILVTSSKPVSIPADVDDLTPCPTPKSGWPHASDATELTSYVNRHPDEFLPPRYTGPSVTSVVKVATVATTTDPSTVRAELTALYAGPLCVYHVARSQTDLSKARAQALEILRRNHISLVSADANTIAAQLPIDYATTTTPLNVTLLTQGAAQELAPLADSITLTASIRPVPRS